MTGAVCLSGDDGELRKEVAEDHKTGGYFVDAIVARLMEEKDAKNAKCILFQDQHFVALRFLDGQWEINFERYTHTWEKADLYRGLQRGHPYCQDEKGVWIIDVEEVDAAYYIASQEDVCHNSRGKDECGESGMPAIGCADDSVDVASQRSGPRTAAKSKAGPSQRVEDSAMRIVKEEDKEADDIPLEDATFERLKQRRHMRGANTSDVDFAHLFNSLAKMNDCFQQEPAEEIDTSDTILHKVRLWQDCVRKTFADGLLGAMKNILLDYDNQENQFLAACVNACLTFEGQQRKEKNREEHADEEQEDEVEDDEEKEQKAQWCAAREAVMDVAFSKKKIFFPEALLTSLKAKGGPNVSREGLLDGLLNMKYLQRLPGSKKADTRYIPVLTAEVSLCDILHHQDRICELELSEMYNIDKFSNYLTQHPHRAANSKILADVLQASSESRRPRAGRPSPEEVKQKEDMQARSRKLRSGETHGEELLEALTEPIQKKRKFSQKKPEVKTENSEDHILIRKVNYQYPGNFLLHSENGGSPHCVAVKQDEEDKLIVFDTDGVFHLAVADFETALLGGVDAATCVIFKLQDGKKDTDVGMSDFENLLDLAAGSSESNEECTTDDAQDTALLPEVSEKKGSFDWLDDTGRVITDQVLLSDLQTEAQKFMEAAKAGQFRAERGAGCAKETRCDR
ncbi:Uncharacterized protein SCF082_LOCUS26239 [Durusdinium trenchii]|uniref:Uncharacterized protein n=1 Tax=Durusdinium trenchii TaxID=1381693 RepID=A0ABP0M7J8_9DINO